MPKALRLISFFVLIFAIGSLLIALLSQGPLAYSELVQEAFIPINAGLDFK